MWTIVPALAALACLSAVIVTVMTRRGVLDVPGARSSHDRPIPKGGGLGIIAAFVLGLIAAWAGGLLPYQHPRATSLLASALLLAAVAWADDVRQFGFATKLAAQIAASILLVGGGFVIDRIGPLSLGILGVPFTVAWLVFATNAINFIDGLNGLASGCTLIASLAVSIVSLRSGDPFIAAALLPLAAGIIGFIPFNYPKARIFMGDVGSQLCGIVLAAMAGPASRLPHHSWGALLVPMALAPILADVAFTLVRRWRAGERLTQAHRGHLYQLLHRAGLPAAQVTLAFWALTLTCAVFGAYASRGPWPVTLLAVLAVLPPLIGSAWLSVRLAARSDLMQRP